MNAQANTSHGLSWLALRLPGLPLQALINVTEQPVAVYEQQRGRPRIIACNRAARSLGIHPGMSINAARALFPGLHAEQREPSRENALLERLAAWSGQFSAGVSLVPAWGLLLEVGGSTHLFGGPQDLLDRVAGGVLDLGYRARLALAPTPIAACWLARDARHPITTPEQLQQRLGALSLATIRASTGATAGTGIELSAKQLDTLTKLGVHTVADCLALPRAGLARRLGKSVPLLLDRALGLAPDPRPAYHPPDRFEASLPLTAPLESCADLLLVIRRLVLELAGFLLARGSGVERLELHLFHHRAPATRLDIGLSAPNRDPEHLLSLVRRRLERVELQEAVIEIGLLAPRLLLLAAEARSLLDDGSAATLGDQRRLLENLRARLGRDAVVGICLLPDYRPERAWGYCEPGERVPVIQHSQRPLWLLKEPGSLDIREQRPCLGALLSLEQGPERIETGWWDGDEVARDYYVACHPDGERYWVFRERGGKQRWFLHGLFA